MTSQGSFEVIRVFRQKVPIQLRVEKGTIVIYDGTEPLRTVLFVLQEDSRTRGHHLKLEKRRASHLQKQQTGVTPCIDPFNDLKGSMHREMIYLINVVSMYSMCELFQEEARPALGYRG